MSSSGSTEDNGSASDSYFSSSSQEVEGTTEDQDTIPKPEVHIRSIPEKERQDVKFGDLSSLPSSDGSDSTYMVEYSTDSDSDPYTFSSDGESSDKEIQRTCPKMRRAQKLCPIDGCWKSIQNVKRHLVNQHGLSSSTAFKLIQRNAEYLRARKDAEYSTCDFCEKRVIRLDIHQASHCHVLRAKLADIRHESQTNNSNNPPSPHNPDSVSASKPAKKRTKAVLDARSQDTLAGFHAWLKSLSGGRMSPTTATQYCSQMSHIIEAIGGMDNVEDLLLAGEPGGVIEEMCSSQMVQATTTKNTLAAMRHFGSYIMDRGEITLAMWLKLDKRVSTWMYSIRKDVSRQRLAVKEQSAAAMPSIVKLMKGYKTSHHARRGSGVLLGIKCQVDKPDASNFDAAQEYLLITLTIETGHRPGVFRHLLVTEIQAAQRQTSGSVTFKAATHKTADTSGPAIIVVDGALWDELRAFMTLRRLYIMQQGMCNMPAHFFLGPSGQPLASNAISRIMEEVFGTTCKTTPTLVRKAHYELVRF